MATLVAVYLLIAWVNGLHLFSEKRKEYVLIFDNVSGLLKGDAVNVFGYPSGKVLDIQPQANAVAVFVSVDERILLYEDAHAEIQLKELMGGRQIALFPGGKGQKLNAGARIFGSAGTDMAKAMSMFGDAVERIDTAQIQQLARQSERMMRAISGAAEQMPIQQSSQMIANLNEVSSSLSRIIAQIDLQKTNHQADSTLAEIRLLMRTTQQTLQQVNSITARVDDKTLNKTDSMMQQSIKLLEESITLMGQAEKSLLRADQLMTKFDSPNSMIGKAMNDPEFAILVDSTMRNFNNTLNHIRKKKIHVSMSASPKPKLYLE